MFLHFRNSINPLHLVQFDIDVFYQVDQKKYHAKYQGSGRFPCYNCFHTSEQSYNPIRFYYRVIFQANISNPIIRFFFQAVVFVIDSSNRERLDEAQGELIKLITEKELKDACLLILLNKQVRFFFFYENGFYSC